MCLISIRASWETGISQKSLGKSHVLKLPKITTLKWALIVGAGVLITAVSLFMFDRFRTIRLKSASAQADRGALSLPIPEKSIGILPLKT
jgi:hypothetical protein